RRADQPTPGAPPADDDEPAVHGAHARGPAGRGERGPRLPPVSILPIQPQIALRHEALLGETAHGVERVAHDGERHVVAWGREYRDVLPTVRGRIVAERGGGGTAGPVDPSGNVDLAAQHRGAELLDRLGQRGGGGPAAVGLGEAAAREQRNGAKTHTVTRGVERCAMLRGKLLSRTDLARWGHAVRRGGPQADGRPNI